MSSGIGPYQVVYFKDIPASVLGEFEDDMYGQAMPAVDKTYAWDFEKFVAMYHQKVRALNAPTLSKKPSVIVNHWNVVKLLGKPPLTCRAINSKTIRRTSEISTLICRI